MHYDPAPNLPKLVIIDVKEFIDPFREAVEKIYHLGIEADVALAEMLDEMSKQDAAHHTVIASSEEIARGLSHTELVEDALIYIAARNRLSASLLKHMTQIGLYVGNVLYYQLRELAEDGTLILQKLEVPLTDKEIYARSIARRADIAYRRYIPRTHEGFTEIAVSGGSDNKQH